MVVFSQLPGAIVRAIIVLIVVVTPSMILPGTTQEGAQVATLLGLALGVFVAFEYATRYPALIEFRDAPPFNRVRILALFLTLFCLSAVASGSTGSTMVLVLNSVGFLVGQAIEFPFSPLVVIMDRLPGGIGSVTAAQLQIMAGLAVFILLAACCIFALLLRLHQWPNRDSAFNVWVNLPTFDPTTGGDVVARLIRDGRFNVILGFVLPFLIPVIGILAADHMDVTLVGVPQAMVWGISIWTFLPLSLFMRGMAMLRIAKMIERRRARLMAGLDGDAASVPV